MRASVKYWYLSRMGSGVSTQRISQLISGEWALTAETALRLEAVLGVAPPPGRLCTGPHAICRGGSAQAGGA